MWSYCECVRRGVMCLCKSGVVRVWVRCCVRGCVRGCVSVVLCDVAVMCGRGAS